MQRELDTATIFIEKVTTDGLEITGTVADDSMLLKIVVIVLGFIAVVVITILAVKDRRRRCRNDTRL